VRRMSLEFFGKRIGILFGSMIVISVLAFFLNKLFDSYPDFTNYLRSLPHLRLKTRHCNDKVV